MEHITIKDIVKVTGGTLLCGDQEKEIKGFSIDSRQGDEDSIFVPIIGERVDAHKFIEQALEKNGATFTSEHETMDSEKPWIYVKDTIKAMQEVGTYYRNQLNLPIVAVTGSVGKTTTREMIACALASSKKVFQTIGNQNSEIGVPLTLSRMTEEDEMAVLEIGMSERGQIETLTNMIRPNVAVVTMIGVSHIEMLKSQENICIEKMDIVKGLPKDGKIFLNGDDRFLKKYKGKLDFETWFYGFGENCDYRAQNVMIKENGMEFDFIYPEGQKKVFLNVLGNHNVQNALAALGITHQMGLSVEKAIEALAGFTGQRQRIVTLSKVTLIDDTYNASPDSMKAALSVLVNMNTTGKKKALLADMLELGKNEVAYHEEIGTFLAEHPIDELITFGPLAKNIAAKWKSLQENAKVVSFLEREEAGNYVKENLSKGDILLLKGSNGMKLKEITAMLEEADKNCAIG